MGVEDAVMRSFVGEVPEGLILRTDNGNVESFHSPLKTDYVWPFEFSDFREASVAIEKTFTDYNENRPYFSIDYFPPREFKRKFLNDW